MSVRRAARQAAYAAAALAVVIAAAALLVPLFLDTPAVERELQAKLSQLVHGEVAWEKLSIRLLPSPRGALTKVKAEIPGVAEVSAEQVDAHLRLLPLLHGRAEIASVSLSKPAIRIQVAPSSRAREAPKDETSPDPQGVYRSVVDGIRRFAPDAEVDVEGGELDVALAGVPPIRVRALELHGRTDSRGIELSLGAASDAWRSLKAEASVAFADSSGEVKAELAGLKPQPWLDLLLSGSPVTVAIPEASVRLEGRSDGKAGLEGRFGVRAATVELARAGERVQIPTVAVDGTMTAGSEELAAGVTGAQVGASSLADGRLRYGLKSRSLAAAAEFDLDLAQAMDATRRLLPEDAGKQLAQIQPVSGRAQGVAKFESRRSGWNALVDVRKSDSSIGMEGLPGPVKVASASVSVTRDATKIDRADVALLDGRALASATISYGKRVRIEGAAEQGSVGEKLLGWVWKTAGVPAHLALKTPVAVKVQRAAWSPGQPLDLAASASFEAGPGVAAELGWSPKALDIRRASIKDAKSDAAVTLHLEKRLLQGKFSGSLRSSSVAAALKGAKVPEGALSGDLSVRFDLDHPERFSATGKLAGESVDLAWLLGRPVIVERFDVQADGEQLRVRRATVNWAKQLFTLRGEATRASDGAPVLDAQIESPGVVVDALLPPSEKKPPAQEKAQAPQDGPLWSEWPLPVRGRIAVRSKFVQYGERRAEPVIATVTLEPERAKLELQQVRLCGIAFPFTADASPNGALSFSVQLVAQKQQLEHTARCLTERGVQMTGEFDLRADLRSAGKRDELLRNLEGTVEAEARNGRVTQFPLILKILSVRDVAESLKQDGVSLSEAGFPYLGITAKGRFDRGRFIAEESSFRSNSVGFAARGSISLNGDPPDPYDTQLTVLVAPLSRLDSLVRAVPIVGYIVGGTLTSWPVRVTRDIRDPKVDAVSPTAITSEFVGMFQRTLKLPEKVLPRLGQ